MSENKKKSPKKINKPVKESQNNSHWVKILYYYLVIAGCLLFFSIGLYWLSRAVIINTFFPVVNENTFSYVDESRRSKEISIRYQEDILNSTLMMVVSVAIYFLHTKIIKIKD